MWRNFFMKLIVALCFEINQKKNKKLHTVEFWPKIVINFETFSNFYKIYFDF